MASPESGAVSATEPHEALRIGIVAGEASGDILGANLMRAILREVPDASFVGIGGDAMRAVGMESLYSIDVLSINGFKDPILRLPSLIGILITLVRSFTGRARTPPVDVVIGVDFNVFNLLLERIVHRRGVPTVHYVSPSVYFWRRGQRRAFARRPTSCWRSIRSNRRSTTNTRRVPYSSVIRLPARSASTTDRQRRKQPREEILISTAMPS